MPRHVGCLTSAPRTPPCGTRPRAQPRRVCAGLNSITGRAALTDPFLCAQQLGRLLGSRLYAAPSVASGAYSRCPATRSGNHADTLLGACCACCFSTRAAVAATAPSRLPGGWRPDPQAGEVFHGRGGALLSGPPGGASAHPHTAGSQLASQAAARWRPTAHGARPPHARNSCLLSLRVALSQ